MSGARRLKVLTDESAKLKKLLAEAMLDNAAVLQDRGPRRSDKLWPGCAPLAGSKKRVCAIAASRGALALSSTARFRVLLGKHPQFSRVHRKIAQRRDKAAPAGFAIVGNIRPGRACRCAFRSVLSLVVLRHGVHQHCYPAMV